MPGEESRGGRQATERPRANSDGGQSLKRFAAKLGSEPSAGCPGAFPPHRHVLLDIVSRVTAPKSPSDGDGLGRVRAQTDFRDGVSDSELGRPIEMSRHSLGAVVVGGRRSGRLEPL